MAPFDGADSDATGQAKVQRAGELFRRPGTRQTRALVGRLDAVPGMNGRLGMGALMLCTVEPVTWSE